MKNSSDIVNKALNVQNKNKKNKGKRLITYRGLLELYLSSQYRL